MRKRCGHHSVIGSPARYAARKTVVDTWQMPPPMSCPIFSPSMTWASTKPLSSSIHPIDSLNENSPQGGIKVPFSKLAPTATLVARPSLEPE